MRSAGVFQPDRGCAGFEFSRLPQCWVSGAFAVWLNPLAIRAEYKILNTVAAAQLTADVEPRVFEDQFTNDNTVLYVNDVKSENGPVAVWTGVFIADLTPPSERKTGVKDARPGPRRNRSPVKRRWCRCEEQSPPAHAARYGNPRIALPRDRTERGYSASGEPTKQQQAKPYRRCSPKSCWHSFAIRPSKHRRHRRAH